jgi:hypothetical protein
LASKRLTIELVLCSYGWWRTSWQTIHMMPGLPVYSIPPCQYNRHEGACPAWFQATCRIEHTFIEAHQVSMMICKVRSLKSWIKTRSFVQDIITSCKAVFRDFVSDIADGNWILGNLIRVTVKGYVIVR